MRPAHRADLHSALGAADGAEEPLQNEIEMVGKPVWFTPEQSQEGSDPVPILISDRAANAVGITQDRSHQAGFVPVQYQRTGFQGDRNFHG